MTLIGALELSLADVATAVSLLCVALLTEATVEAGVGKGGLPSCVYTLRIALESFTAFATDNG